MASRHWAFEASREALYSSPANNPRHPGVPGVPGARTADVRISFERLKTVKALQGRYVPRSSVLRAKTNKYVSK